MAWDVDPPVWVVEIIALPSSPMCMEPATDSSQECSFPLTHIETRLLSNNYNEVINGRLCNLRNRVQCKEATTRTWMLAEHPRCIVQNDGVDDVLVEAAVAVTSGEENDGEDDVPEDKGSESVMEGDKDGGEEEDDNEE
ncbi:hypothetical protein F2Q69_00016008 [Brassica cretica]|uniref:Uncharacterized protein n=1 Tax=Brassica cretica TaxID=69181 RepID=A0A8S9QGL6_BRACR|nr:hypothetical protein F2Q69_00016008 [Brassica cretica]